MKQLIELITGLLVVIPWLAGIAIAKGGWSTVFSILVPPYSWYLVIEKLINGTV